jgi:hypothetical protein
MGDKTLLNKQMIEQLEPPLKTWVNFGAMEGFSVPAQLVVPIV